MNEDDVLRNQLNAAPPEIKEILKSDLVSTVVNDLVQRYHFSEEQKRSLGDEVMFVLLAMALRTDFARQIRIEMRLDQSLATTIDLEIARRIFNPVIALLPTRKEGAIIGSIKAMARNLLVRANT